MQNASHLLMIRPKHFGFNEETAPNNYFQQNISGNHQQKALKEFEAFLHLLRQNNILVTVINDTNEAITPDAIFPNNWISFDEEKGIFLYPMFAANRRLERNNNIITQLKQLFPIKNSTDLSYFENEHKFLEGTGSMVLDRINKIAYACLSPRTNKEVLDEYCRLTRYTPCTFTSFDTNRKEIYHTNVMMCVAKKFVVICLETIVDADEKNKVLASLQKTNHEIIDISFEQVTHFAGNMLEVINTEGNPFLVMSSQALASLSEKQLAQLKKYANLLAPTISTIETIGGGGVRCMLAEVFLPKL